MSRLDSKSPYDRLCAAISIIQAHILAEDSKLISGNVFGTNYMPSASLELCEGILVDLLEDVETLDGNGRDAIERMKVD